VSACGGGICLHGYPGGCIRCERDDALALGMSLEGAVARLEAENATLRAALAEANGYIEKMNQVKKVDYGCSFHDFLAQRTKE